MKMKDFGPFLTVNGIKDRVVGQYAKLIRKHLGHSYPFSEGTLQTTSDFPSLPPHPLPIYSGSEMSPKPGGFS